MLIFLEKSGLIRYIRVIRVLFLLVF